MINLPVIPFTSAAQVNSATLVPTRKPAILGARGYLGINLHVLWK